MTKQLTVFISLLYLIAKTSSKTMNRTAKRICLVPDLRENAFILSSFTCDLIYMIQIDAFYQFDEVSVYSKFGRNEMFVVFFNHECMLNFVK